MEYTTIIGYIITAVTSITVTVLGSKWFGEIIFRKGEPVALLKPKLINHNVFNVIEEVRNDIKRVEFFIDLDHKTNDVTKEKMFIDFMNHKLNSVSKHTLAFMKREDELIGLSKTELHNYTVGLIHNITNEYMAQAKSTFINKGLTVKDAEYIIGLFEEWRYDTIKAMKYQIEYLFSSEYHSTNYDILLSILEIFSFSILLVPKDGIQSFNEFNGKFSEVAYE